MKALLRQREDQKRMYDHYDEKLEKMIKQRVEKSSKNLSETEKEALWHERVKNFVKNQNDVKYKASIENLAKTTLLANDLLCDLIDYRINYINPSIANVRNICYVLR